MEDPLTVAFKQAMTTSTRNYQDHIELVKFLEEEEDDNDDVSLHLETNNTL